MLYAFGFDRIGVVVGDLYFVDPAPDAGQEGAERGVRLELRALDAEEPPGTIYAARPIRVGKMLWRADLLETIDNPGSFVRTHHHPYSEGWEPGGRAFDREMSADPVAWVGRRLAGVDGLLAELGLRTDAVTPEDAAALGAAVPEICEVTQRLLDRVRAGELARPPADAGASDNIRAGWL